jgi:adenine-specific DNA-methyltransferase
VSSTPLTEGIKYAGSKLKLLPCILQLVKKTGAATVLDGFAGTTRVSQALAQAGLCVVANDVAVWSEIFGTCYLLNEHPPQHYQPLIDHLNALPGRDGWFTEHYGGEPNGGCSAGPDGLKKPWQKHNTQRLDAVREEIDRLSLSETERAVLLTSLILALDQVDNMLGHHVSYLREWSSRAYRPLWLQVPRLLVRTQPHTIRRGDIFAGAADVEVDLAYFDPPYGSKNEKMPPSRVRYAAYYHLWTTICLNDRPSLFGKAKRRVDTTDSVAGSPFEDFRRDASGRFLAVEAIGRLLRETRARHMILSYSSGGRATAEDLAAAIASAGRVKEVLEIDFRRNVMAGMRWTHEWVADAETPNREFLFLIEKT